MRRRDLLRGAALAGASVAFPAAASISDLETTARKPLGKIAMEEHFMVPEFMEYFAETYANISADIAKLAPGALMDFGERRLAMMDEHHVEYVVLSLAGLGVQAEKDGAVAQRKARAVNDLLAGEIQKRPARYGGFAHLAMHNPSEAAEELERCMRDLGFHGALINGQTNGEYLDLDKYSVFWERAAALDAPIYLHPGNPADHPSTYAGHSELWGRFAAGPSKRRRMRYGWCSPESSSATPRQGSFSVTAGKHCLSACGVLTADGWSAIEAAARLPSRPLSTFVETLPSPPPACARTIRCAARLTRWALRT